MSLESAAWRDILAQRVRDADPVGNRVPDYALGAVALIVYPRGDQLRFLAMERHEQLPYHGGQIGLPGGGVREDSETPQQAALREVEEELGLPGHRLTLLGTLGHFPISVTRWDVLAYLGWWDGREPLCRQESEVETILEVPLPRVLAQHQDQPAAHERVGPAGSTPIFPEYLHHQDGRTYRIWGCTGRIVHHFLETIYVPARRVLGA